MLSNLFLGLSLLGAEWVLYVLLGLSIYSVALILERFRFYSLARKDLESFRADFKKNYQEKNNSQALKLAEARFSSHTTPDLETELAISLLKNPTQDESTLMETALESILKNKLLWEKNLNHLATIGSSAPFIGLFGTVLGIIKAFHDLSKQSGAAAQTVTAGISEALVATAIGLLVAIPATIAYNTFQRKVQVALTEAESLKCFIFGKRG